MSTDERRDQVCAPYWMRLETVSKLLGHSDVRVTQAAYAHLEDSTVRDEFMRIVA